MPAGAVEPIASGTRLYDAYRLNPRGIKSFRRRFETLFDHFARCFQ